MVKSEAPKDCNCINCRLSRIEDQLCVIENIISNSDTPSKSKKKKS